MQTKTNFDNVFTPQTLETLFPRERSDTFFDALFGDAAEGAYDICLVYHRGDDHQLEFGFHLLQRPGKCLACNLTYGLPEVFVRHPVINVKRLVERIGELLAGRATIQDWHLGKTEMHSRELHVIPLSIDLAPA